MLESIFNKKFNKETLAQVLSCEFCEISKNTLFTEQLRATPSGTSRDKLLQSSDMALQSLYIIAPTFIKFIQ